MSAERTPGLPLHPTHEGVRTQCLVSQLRDRFLTREIAAVGDCAFDGGLFAESYAVAGGVGNVVPVHLHIRGCPPTPTALLRGLLALLEHQ